MCWVWMGVSVRVGFSFSLKDFSPEKSTMTSIYLPFKTDTWKAQYKMASGVLPSAI